MSSFIVSVSCYGFESVMYDEEDLRHAMRESEAPSRPLAAIEAACRYFLYDEMDLDDSRLFLDVFEDEETDDVYVTIRKRSRAGITVAQLVAQYSEVE